MSDPWAVFLFFFFNDTATTEIYTLSLHDALPILAGQVVRLLKSRTYLKVGGLRSLDQSVEDARATTDALGRRSEEHTSELQSRPHLVCRLLLEKKNASGPGAGGPDAGRGELSGRF